jgi:hypothetical protein
MVDPVFRMEKNEIDKAVGDKTHKVFDENFAIEVRFDPVSLYDSDAPLVPAAAAGNEPVTPIFADSEEEEEEEDDDE